MQDLLEAYIDQTIEEYESINEGILKDIKDGIKSKINRKLQIGKECYCVKEYNTTSVGKECYIGEVLTKTKTSATEQFLISKIKVATKEDGKIYIYKKYQNKIESFDDVYLIKGNVIKIESWGDITIKVTEINKVKLKDLLKQIDYEYKDNSSVVSKRKQIYNNVMNITKQVLNEMGKDKLKGGFTLTKLDEDEKEYLEEFTNGFCNYFNIIECDAWKFTNNKARDDSEYDKYEKVFLEILSKLDEKFKKNNIPGGTDYHGDWDDGPIVFVLTEK